MPWTRADAIARVDARGAILSFQSGLCAQIRSPYEPRRRTCSTRNDLAMLASAVEPAKVATSPQAGTTKKDMVGGTVAMLVHPAMPTKASSHRTGNLFMPLVSRKHARSDAQSDPGALSEVPVLR